MLEDGFVHQAQCHTLWGIGRPQPEKEMGMIPDDFNIPWQPLVLVAHAPPVRNELVGDLHVEEVEAATC